jgi:hypothetical protein
MPEFRRLALFVTIGSFSFAALLGVLALLSGGDFGEGEVDVLLTTLLVGITSVAVLCYLATADTPFRVVGALGGLAALPTLGVGLLLVWTRIGDTDEALSWKSFGIGSVASASLAQVSLLLVLAAAAAPYVRALLAATLAAVAWVAVHVSVIILAVDAADGSLRLLGVVAILDVLGTVAVAALAKFGGDRRTPVARLEVPAELTPMVMARARATGRSPEAVVRAAVLAGLDAESTRG